MTNHFLNNTTNNSTPEKTCAWTLLLDATVWPTVVNGYGDQDRRNMEVQSHGVQDGSDCSSDATVKSKRMVKATRHRSSSAGRAPKKKVTTHRQNGQALMLHTAMAIEMAYVKASWCKHRSTQRS